LELSQAIYGDEASELRVRQDGKARQLRRDRVPNQWKP